MDDKSETKENKESKANKDSKEKKAKKAKEISSKSEHLEAIEEIEHTFFLENMDNAQALSEELTVMGHQVKSIEKTDDEEQDGFYVETIEKTTLARAALNAANLEVLAQEFDAAYDGWAHVIK